MSRIRLHPLFPYMLTVTAIAGLLLWPKIEAIVWEKSASWAIGALGAALLLIWRAELRDKFSLFVSALSLVAATWIGGFHVAFVVLAIETLLALSLEKRNPAARMYLVLALNAFVAAHYLDADSAALSLLIYAASRLLLVPAPDESEECSIFFGALPVFSVAFSAGFGALPEAGAVLGGVALINVIFGRALPALWSALLALVMISPALFIFAGPIVALGTAGLWGRRAAAVLIASASVIVLMQDQSPLQLAAASLAGAACGLALWSGAQSKIFWPAVAAFAGALGAGIYLNQEWFLQLEAVTAPEQAAGLGAFGIAAAAGFWLKKYLPLVPKLKRPAWRKPRIAMPVVSVPELRLGFLGAISRHQDFATMLFLAAAAAAVWIVRAAL